MHRGETAAFSLLIFVSCAMAGAGTASATTGSFRGFVANRGQLHGPAAYYAIGDASAVYFERDAVVLERSTSPDRRQGFVLRVEFPRRSLHATPRGVDQLPQRFHVYSGADRSTWRMGVPAYSQVHYRGIAPGADLVYRVQDERLEYDVVVAPGADLEGVRLRYRGAKRLSIDADGGLVVHTSAGDLREGRPFLYQDREGRRVAIDGGFEIRSSDELGFWSGNYDRSLPLVVDPGILWSTFQGGSADDVAYGVTADASGNVYVVGRTHSTNYPTTSGAFQRTMAGVCDVTVTKMLANGGGIAWSTLLGGAGYDEGKSVALDASGNVYLCGHTGSLNFPVTGSAFQRVSGGGVYDGFVAKLGGDGSLQFSSYLGGSGDDYARVVRVDGSGRPVVAGQTGSTNFPTTSGVVRPVRSPSFFDGSDGFLTKLNSAGSALVYSTYIGSNANSEGVNGLALDSGGRPVMTGNTASTTFPVTTGAFDREISGPQDAFVTCLDANASSYVFSTYLGGAAYEAGMGVGFGPDGSVIVAGRTSSSDFPTSAGAFQGTFGGGNFYDVFVSRLTASGGSLMYSTFLGGGGTDTPWSLHVTPAGEACVTGYTDNGTFPVSPGAYDTGFNGGLDAILSVVSADGRQLKYSTFLGGTGNDQGMGIAGRSGGQLVVCGLTSDGSFPTTSGAWDRSHNGALDGFVLAFDTGGGSVGVDDVTVRLHLSPPSPNPFTSSTLFGMVLTEPLDVSVRIIDASGRVVRVLQEGSLGAGNQTWRWDGTRSDGVDAGSGVFFIDVVAGTSRGVTRVVRIK